VLFNSLDFLIFFPIVYLVYLLLPFRMQNGWLLLASYFFYACWDYRFVALLIGSTSVAYFCSLVMVRTSDVRKKKLILALSICVDLGILAFFKYWNFFAPWKTAWQIILPVGISFYTFHSIGYAVDVYRGTILPPKKISDYALFVSFFPLLVAGPIERSKNLFPQIQAPRAISFAQIQSGAFLILFGLFQKMFVADNLSVFVDRVFSNSRNSGLEVLLALYAFAIQIYCDFAGYTNIAKGVASLLGFDLISNFNRPYFAISPTDFWHRWHISLSSWLRDYLYKPLGGSRGGTLLTFRNLMVTMLLGGLWHGANWTFVVWGAYHGILLIFHKRLSPKFGRFIPKGLSIFIVFNLVCLGWLFFRAESIHQALGMLGSLGSLLGSASWGAISVASKSMLEGLAIFAGGLLVLEIYEEKTKKSFVAVTFHGAAQVGVALLMFYSLILYGVTDAKTFLYFQF
jgi:D-alanyl-lipoteichoic acid acyltransferase DltB (MBOAT superfamily)